MTALGAAAIITKLMGTAVAFRRCGRAKLSALHGERLAAVAKSAGVSIPAESLDVIALQGKNTAAFVAARIALGKLWTVNGGDQVNLTYGIAIVRGASDTSSTFRYLVHSTWAAGMSQYNSNWRPRPDLLETTRAKRAGYTPVYELDGVKILTAAAPILREDGSAAGFVVTTLDATSFLDDLEDQILRLAALSLLAFAIAVPLSIWLGRRLS